MWGSGFVGLEGGRFCAVPSGPGFFRVPPVESGDFLIDILILILIMLLLFSPRFLTWCIQYSVIRDCTVLALRSLPARFQNNPVFIVLAYLDAQAKKPSPMAVAPEKEGSSKNRDRVAPIVSLLLEPTRE